VGTYCYVAVCRRGGRLGDATRFGAHIGRREGHIVAAARLQLVMKAGWHSINDIKAPKKSSKIVEINGLKT